MTYDETLSKKDIIFDSQYNISIILNENYSQLRSYVNLYFMSLLLDIKVGAQCGYSFYNKLIEEYYIYEDVIFMKEIFEAREEIKFLEKMIIVEHRDASTLLDIFISETSEEYKLIERELLIYINLMKSIIGEKVRI